MILNSDNAKISHSEREFKQQSEIFQILNNLTTADGFDYCFYKDITIISSIAERKINKRELVLECQFDGMGDYWIPLEQFILFFNYEEASKENKDLPLFVKSLNFPNKQFIKDKLQFRRKPLCNY
ncbi:hypothetical protein GH808_03805 [Acetobacterium fimetarium]|uniref:Uncharacterized protein n=1 Tax=Acetobacterium fimetarium TaxID=52691 RepID=A0ABR6WT54_9FIRM|nr:hypothetical protein [Acetobacterium fimetarium]MBC3803560.1 hypothetical protein [Acetobacterium fimetarium]